MSCEKTDKTPCATNRHRLVLLTMCPNVAIQYRRTDRQTDRLTNGPCDMSR